ncbi:DUF6316 family protein [Agaribacterium sp. ZY112]|uniref:DUF6316 family protein n=1 Tax=Agaribacterium sp. ZY112 TaxID=3233574 RepID=UPI003524503B
MNRTGESNTTTDNRSSRFFQEGAYWYYNTREGVAIGPFDSLSEAETGASDFIDFIMHAEPKVSETLSSYAA